jgi:amino acid transporter
MGGAGPTGSKHYAEYWHLPGLENGLANGFKGMASGFVTAGFAAGGTEMVGVIAGESVHPRYNIPRATKTLVWRIVIFYVTSTLFLTFVIPYNNPNLVGATNASSSPFVLAINQAGIAALPDILNAVVILCVISVGSCSLYTASRILRSMAEDGFFPKYLKRTDKQGRPYAALATTAVVVIGLAYVNLASSGSDVFTWFSSISGMAYLLSWSTVIAANWRFRKAIKAQGSDLLDHKFSFRQKGYPYLPAFAFIGFVFMVC